jgi:hypothetical protein
MKLKLTPEGFAVVENGHPVYVDDQGVETAIDVPHTVNAIKNLSREAKGHRLAKEEAEAKLKAFSDLDPDAARSAIETVSKLDQKRLIDAGEVDKVREQADKAWADKMAAVENKYKPVVEERDALASKLVKQQIGSDFARSKFIADKLAIPADLAQSHFGAHFRVENDVTVAYAPNGEKLYSKQRPGELAGFDEALELLVEAYPHRDSILKGSGASGGGAPGSGGASGGKVVNRQQFESMDASARASFLKSGGKLTD